jgi:tellurite methyltransferase
LTENRSVQLFDEQFRRQVAANDYSLNPFETAALPHVSGRMLDYGCGLGNLSVAAARRGCSVLALDASRSAIEHLRDIATHEALWLRAEEVDLRTYRIAEVFDAIVCIGLLMFFDCPTALRQLDGIRAHVRPGGIAVVNVLIEGTTFVDMFAPEGHCLFEPEQLRNEFSGWELLSHAVEAFAAPRDTRKVFATVIARKPCSERCAETARLNRRNGDERIV